MGYLKCMENIFIVSYGNDYEGGEVDSVWMKREDAEARKVQIQHDSDWVIVEEHAVG